MVRVGGGWDEFEHFLSRHDPEKIGKVLICEFYNHIFKNIQYSFLIYPDIALMVYAWQHGKEITLKNQYSAWNASGMAPGFARREGG